MLALSRVNNPMSDTFEVLLFLKMDSLLEKKGCFY